MFFPYTREFRYATNYYLNLHTNKDLRKPDRVLATPCNEIRGQDRPMPCQVMDTRLCFQRRNPTANIQMEVIKSYRDLCIFPGHTSCHPMTNSVPIHRIIGEPGIPLTHKLHWPSSGLVRLRNRNSAAMARQCKRSVATPTAMANREVPALQIGTRRCPGHDGKLL